VLAINTELRVPWERLDHFRPASFTKTKAIVQKKQRAVKTSTRLSSTRNPIYLFAIVGGDVGVGCFVGGGAVGVGGFVAVIVSVGVGYGYGDGSGGGAGGEYIRVGSIHRS
jgi:hypothetical protein